MYSNFGHNYVIVQLQSLTLSDLVGGKILLSYGHQEQSHVEMLLTYTHVLSYS